MRGTRYHNWMPHFHTLLTSAGTNMSASLHSLLFLIDCVVMSNGSEQISTVLISAHPSISACLILVVRYDIILKQSVGTEDIFIGLSGKDPSSMCCEAMLVTFILPNCFYTKLSDLFTVYRKVRDRVRQDNRVDVEKLTSCNTFRKLNYTCNKNKLSYC